MSTEKIATLERRCMNAPTDEERLNEYFSSFDAGDNVEINLDDYSLPGIVESVDEKTKNFTVKTNWGTFTRHCSKVYPN